MTEMSMAGLSSFTDSSKKADVLRALNSAGFKITRRTFYRDCEKGKLSPNEDGLYTKRLVKAYAQKYILPPAAPGTEALEAKKIRLQIQKLEQENEQNAFKFAKERGRYIKRDQISHEMAARGVVLDSGTVQMFRAKAREWCVLVGGDPERAPELVEAMITGWNCLLNEYSRIQAFTVIFETENEEDGEA